jgi:hypothetical protein
VLHGGPGNDLLHALAGDGDPDVLDCGPGFDTAFVLASERATTTFRGCERIVVELAPTAQDTADNADNDGGADG